MMHSVDGFTIKVLLTNYGDKPSKLDRLEFDWWLSDQENHVQSKTVNLQQPLPLNETDKQFNIRLTDAEATGARADLRGDLHALYRLLHGKARVYFYSGGALSFTETPPFKIL